MKAVRNLSIDLIKVIAMLFVMALHSVSPVNNYYIAIASGIAIPLFFMVSGYLLIEKKGGWDYSFKKIWSIVRFVTLLTIPIALLNRIFLHIDWLDTIAWIKEFVGPYLQRSNLLWAMWYLGAMIIIYLLLPTVHYIYRRYGRFSLVILALVFAVICSVFFTLNIIKMIERPIYQTLRVHNWILYFLLGSCVRLYQPPMNRFFHDFFDRQWTCWLIPVMTSGAYVLFVKYVTGKHVGGVEYHFGSMMCIFYTLVTFICVLFYKPGIVFSKYIAWLSKLFLPVYVLHVFVIYALKKILPIVWQESLAGVCTWLIICITTILISWITMKTSIGRWIFKI